MGCLAYSDDFLLIFSTATGLQKMMDMCVQYANVHYLKINGKKCSVIGFIKSVKSSRNLPEFSLNGITLSCQENINHLAVVLDMLGRDQVAVDARKFFGAVNSAVARMGGSCLSDSTWKKIVDIQLFSISSFGSQLWNLDKTSTAKTPYLGKVFDGDLVFDGETHCMSA